MSWRVCVYLKRTHFILDAIRTRRGESAGLQTGKISVVGLGCGFVVLFVVLPVLHCQGSSRRGAGFCHGAIDGFWHSLGYGFQPRRTQINYVPRGAATQWRRLGAVTVGADPEEAMRSCLHAILSAQEVFKCSMSNRLFGSPWPGVSRLCNRSGGQQHRCTRQCARRN